jgi:hypothetical protein
LARAHARGDRALEHHSGYKKMRWMRQSMAPGIYSPKALQVRKEEIGRRIWSVAALERKSDVGVGRKMVLTCGPMASATGRRTPARTPGLWWLGP